LRRRQHRIRPADHVRSDHNRSDALDLRDFDHYIHDHHDHNDDDDDDHLA
jgi:hypothetical protein